MSDSDADADSETEFAVDPPEWESGDMVQWIPMPDKIGRIVHVPEDQNILMVDLLEKQSGEWVSSGYTLTAGYQDVRPMRGEAEVANEQRERRAAYAEFSSDNDYSDEQNIAGKFGLNTEFASPKIEALGDGFNKHGVRENDDGSIDVRFNAMEPGVRKDFHITEDFLERVASHDYGRLPVQLDHSDSQRANVGYIEPDNIKYSDGFLRLQIHIPDTGSTLRDDVISDFTHDPPAIKDVSVSFDDESVEVEKSGRNEAPKFVDAKLREVSLTPFPAGYDNGGLTPAFSDVTDDNSDDEDDASDVTSQLRTKHFETK